MIDVPVGGAEVQYGFGIAGPGVMWIDEPKLEVVVAGIDVPSES